MASSSRGTTRSPIGRDDRLVSAVTYALITLCAVTILYPMLNILSVSFSSHASYVKNPMMIFPTHLDTLSYKAVFSSKLLINSYGNTVIITILGTLSTLLITVLYAYPLSRPQLRLKPFFTTFIVITMMFNGGIVPNFLLIRSLGLFDTLASQWLPIILGAYNCILMINFFRALPDVGGDGAVTGYGSQHDLLTPEHEAVEGQRHSQQQQAGEDPDAVAGGFAR